jgi:hypothetical protein
MVETLFLTQFDLQPEYKVTVTDSTGGVVDITGAAIRTTMRLSRSTTVKIDRSTAINISSAAEGKFEYQWQSSDTDTTGTYDIEFEITPVAGGKFTVPNRTPTEGVAKVRIVAGLDST